MTISSQRLLSLLILSAVVYESYGSGFSSLHCCERQCTGSNEVCSFITDVPQVPGAKSKKDRWECVIGCDNSLPSPAKGDVVITGSLVGLPGSLRYAVGATATYSCDQGCVMVGGTNPRQCQADGTWSGSQPSCNSVNCGVLQLPCDGPVHVDLSGIMYGDEATFGCDYGFTVAGQNTSECQANGEWSGSIPYCVPETCTTVYEETAYPIREEDGASWRPFWWYNATGGGWPMGKNDTLGDPFGCCNPASHYCFGRLPQHLVEDETEILAVDSADNVYRWTFDSSNPTANAVWRAFYGHEQTGYSDVQHNAEWKPTIVTGGPYHTTQDSWMYRMEHGVASFILDDDNCDCKSTLNAGHAMCHGGFSSSYGTENVYGVGLLNENGCGPGKGPSETNSLFLYYEVPSDPGKKK